MRGVGSSGSAPSRDLDVLMAELSSGPGRVAGTRGRPLLLDLYCGAGGAGAGYHDAGFDVVGVDIAPQPRYPFQFHQAEALDYLTHLFATGDIERFAAFHASPPCQAFSNAQRIRQYAHADFIAPTREMLKLTGLPYVIENVVGAPLIDPIMLCGAMFGLRTYRHRLFETSFPVVAPEHPTHVSRQAKMGRPVEDDQFIQVVGNFSNVALAREAMQMPWATRDELREAIPPTYTKWIGERLLVLVGASL